MRSGTIARSSASLFRFTVPGPATPQGARRSRAVDHELNGDPCERSLHVGAHKTGTSLIQKFFRDEVAPAATLPIAVVGRADTNRLIGWGQQLEGRLAHLRRVRRYDTFCLNDSDLGETDEVGKARLMSEFFRAYFPEPSSFER